MSGSIAAGHGKANSAGCGYLAKLMRGKCRIAGQVSGVQLPSELRHAVPFAVCAAAPE
jgi:hypothetical protein